MKCSSCGNENKQDSRFCRHCGTLLGGSGMLHMRKNYFRFLKKFNTRQYIIAIACLFLFAGVAYASVEGRDYFKVSAAISKAQELNQNDDYKDALAALTNVRGDAVFSLQKSNLNNMIQNESSFITDANLLLEASTSIAAGDMQGAENILAGISVSFPQYNVVKGELLQIGQNLQSQATQAKADAAQQAQAKASAEAEAQAAQTQATAATNAQATADAQAAAATKQAQEAQEAEQEQAQQQTAQIRQTAINQLQSLYSVFNTNGIDYYNEAIDNYNAGEDYSATAEIGQAEATFETNEKNANDLYNSYTSLDSDVATAINDLVEADNYCLEASNSLVLSLEGSDTDVTTNSEGDSCTSYGSLVSQFLQSQ